MGITENRRKSEKPAPVSRVVHCASTWCLLLPVVLSMPQPQHARGCCLQKSRLVVCLGLGVFRFFLFLLLLPLAGALLSSGLAPSFRRCHVPCTCTVHRALYIVQTGLLPPTRASLVVELVRSAVHSLSKHISKHISKQVPRLASSDLVCKHRLITRIRS